MKPAVPSHWRRVLLVCAKCSKKVGRGFGVDGDATLAKALRVELGVRKGRKASAGVVEVKCLGVCPKDAIVTMDAAAPTCWLMVRPHTKAADVVAALGNS